MENLSNLPLDMSFDVSSLIAGLIFGTIGFWMFQRGRKKTNMHVIVIGIFLMVYPMFIDGVMMNWLVGFLSCGAAYYFWEAENA